MKNVLTKLTHRLREIHDLKAAAELLGWDQQIHMPPGGEQARVRQSGVLASLAHQKLCEAELGELLEAVGASVEQDDATASLVREAQRDRDQALRLDPALVRRLAEATGSAHSRWVAAREKADFSLFVSALQTVVDLKRREAEALRRKEHAEPYDALLDTYEPGTCVTELDPLVAETCALSRQVYEAVRESGRPPDVEVLKQGFAREVQHRFSCMLLEAIGFDFERGRLDCSIHPFTTSFDPGDVRVTTRFQEQWLPASVFSTLHEGGHGLYEQGLETSQVGTPLAQPLSLGIHESQSRFWENQIGRSEAFWRHFYPQLKKLFDAQLATVECEDFYRAINAVDATLIRVEADEVTYNLHIGIRYDLEKALLRGELQVDELPSAFNAAVRTQLGLETPNDTVGVLQDIHWSLGLFGYFPTYLLGNIYAAEWARAAATALGDLSERVAAGRLKTIRDWLRHEIHRHGRRYTVHQLFARVCGRPPSPQSFGQYLKDKYGPIYGLSL